MGKSGYKKFLKKERARVKLKGKKPLLPKGQNVTDVNFKVKKIVIKGQLKDHELGEVLSKRKLNIQEVLSRLDHHNTNAKLDALMDVEGMLEENTQALLECHLAPIINHLAKLITSDTSELRKKSNNIMAKIMKEASEDKCNALYEVIQSRICCGLTSLDHGIRFDSLQMLDNLTAVCSSKLSTSVHHFLPILLDLISRNESDNKRTLNIHIGHKQSAGKWRSGVLTRILNLLNPYESSTLDCPNKNCLLLNEKELTEGKNPVNVPLYPSFLLPNEAHSLSLCDAPKLISYSTCTTFNFKEFTAILVPVMLDSFTELILTDEDAETTDLITTEAAALLQNVVDILLVLRTILLKEDANNEVWFKNKFGHLIYSRLVDTRFPYRLESLINNKREKRQSAPKQINNSYEISLAKQNLSLGYLVLLIVQQSMWQPVINYLKESMRQTSGLKSEELYLLSNCILSIISNKKVKEPGAFLSILLKLMSDRSAESYLPCYRVFSSVALDSSLRHLHKEASFESWIGSLVGHLVKKKFTKEELDITLKIASRNYQPFIDSLDSLIEQLLDSLNKMKVDDSTKLEISNLLYWVSDWDSELVENLSKGISNAYWGTDISQHIFHLVIKKSFVKPDLQEMLSSHDWWKSKI